MNAGKIVSPLAGLVFLGSALAFGFWPDRHEQPPVSAAETAVRVAPVRVAGITREVRLSGVTRAAHRAVLAFSVPARLNERPVTVGDHLTAGETVAVLDVRQFENAVAAARARKAELGAELAQAKRDADRIAILKKEKVVPVGEFERVTTGVERLQSALAEADAGLAEAMRARAEAELRAPFAGTITAVHLEPGEWAMPGQPVAEISGDGAVELEVDVPETVIGRFAEGDSVALLLPFAGDRRLSGRVDAVARAALASGRLFPLVVSIDSAPGLIPGMTAEVILTIATEPQILVPVDAVVNPGASRPHVFVVNEGRAHEVPVSLGMFSGDEVAVNGRLAAGDNVVVAGHTSLADGKSVVVK